jgi:hypothetical protein
MFSTSQFQCEYPVLVTREKTSVKVFYLPDHESDKNGEEKNFSCCHDPQN